MATISPRASLATAPAPEAKVPNLGKNSEVIPPYKGPSSFRGVAYTRQRTADNPPAAEAAVDAAPDGLELAPEIAIAAAEVRTLGLCNVKPVSPEVEARVLGEWQEMLDTRWVPLFKDGPPKKRGQGMKICILRLRGVSVVNVATEMRVPIAVVVRADRNLREATGQTLKELRAAIGELQLSDDEIAKVCRDAFYKIQREGFNSDATGWSEASAKWSLKQRNSLADAAAK